MNDDAALNLIKNTFENSFDRERFLIFAKNLFHFLDTDSFIYRGNLIPDAYDSHIKTLERLGKYEDVDGHKIEVLAVCLNKQSALERARTLQRNFIAWYLNGSRGGITKDAALVAFYTKDSDDWRLSLVKMDYHLGESKAGKIKAITELTPARRFSFLVGANENTHTAQRQLLPILKDTDFKPALSDLESAFSVEVVTKDFFEKYKKLFLDTKEALDAMVAKDDKIKADFQEKNIDTTDFAKKLLGQIVFLYFLQKKGWFGVARDAVWGTGPKDFLRRLFERQLTEYDNFFNNILEPLFYEALAVERTDDFYSKFNCKIPFLNGGLFDPLGNYDWVHTDIRLPDDLFSNNRKTKEGDTGDGILDVFDRYNFTVKEDEPLEREVAVDPEMLGKVFENLLEVKDRKSKGTYYTPREIVHYMCQESLINYLLTELDGKVKRDDIETLIRLGETAIENEALVMDKGFETKDHHFKLPQSIRDNATLLDEKLEKIHVCDPAVGSGAFLVGMMTEVIRVRNILTRYLADNGRSIYDFKRHAIQNCLYGVDIDPGAVEIAKLRLWLSLIVDEQDIKQIKPLPNLDYKIMQGNSLLEEYEGVKLDVDGHGQPQQMKFDQAKTESEILKEKLVDLRKEFFRTAHKTEKDALKKQIEDLTWQLIEVSLKEQKKLSLLPEIERFKKTNIKPFFLWKLNFSEVFERIDGESGFDVIIANPPYAGERKHKDIFINVQNGNLKKYYLGRMDYFYFFFHFGLNALKINGILSFISTNYFITALGARKLRQDIKDRSEIICFIDFEEFKIFNSAQGQHNMISILQRKENPSDDHILKSTIVREGENSLERLTNILLGVDKDSYYFSIKQKEIFEDRENYIRLGGNIYFEGGNVQGILKKVKESSGGTTLSNICNPIIGLESSLDDVFIVSNDKINKITKSDYEKSYFMPFFKNSDIKRFYYKTKSDFSILYLHEEIKDKIENLTGIYSYLLKHKVALFGRKGANLRGAFKRKNWWVLNTPRLNLNFNAPKIITPYRSKTTHFAYCDIPWYASRDVYYITPRDTEVDLKYVLPLLNSKLYYLWLYYKGKRKGEMLELYQKPLSEVPIKKIPKEKQQPFIDITNKILAITNSDGYLNNSVDQAKVKDYEKQLDELVYKLYGLTPEEIAIVEANTN